MQFPNHNQQEYNTEFFNITTLANTIYKNNTEQPKKTKLPLEGAMATDSNDRKQIYC